MNTNTVVQVRTFLSRSLGIHETSLQDDDALFSSGVIDSMSLIELLAFIESDLKVQVSLAELSIDNFDTIQSIVSYVERRQNCH